MDRMRFARGVKFFLLVVTSICGLFVWSSLKASNEQDPALSIEMYNINRKSLEFQGVTITEKEKDKNSKSRDHNNVMINTNDVHKLERQNTAVKKTGVINDRVKQSRTVLMSYMRSGSTFTGDLFQASSDVMYMYEPLLYTNDADELPKNTPIKSRVIYKFFKDTNPPQTLDYILDTLRCNLTDSNLRYMIGYSYSRSFDNYANCLKGLSRPLGSNTCGQNTMRRCQQSRNVISKILRLKMWEIDELLGRDPELQIIHLVRDPRGIAMSRTVAHYYFNVRTLCSRMNTDASRSIDLQKKYPGRILTVRYEDLALSPMNVTRTLFQHAGVKWSQQIADKVQDLTSPSNNTFDETIFGTKRKNSSNTAFNWRSKLPFSTAVEIQKSCQQMMDLYGYNIFRSHSEMKDLRSPSIKSRYTDKYYKGQNFSL